MLEFLLTPSPSVDLNGHLDPLWATQDIGDDGDTVLILFDSGDSDDLNAFYVVFCLSNLHSLTFSKYIAPRSDQVTLCTNKSFLERLFYMYRTKNYH